MRVGPHRYWITQERQRTPPCRQGRNTNARRPDVLAAQRKEHARIHSEKGIRWGGRPLGPVSKVAPAGRRHFRHRP
ncbi:hypothetical protein FGD71_035995 [Streptomyces sporangiiformans]|uniref:Uncharacterized protein n=1 Tax=Streptomyces sporangiiformans TaxID=2315329 RepID=A0A505DA16_9ACTN|nr:hypothetical protein FGD71_035995 [Streptomyces sporangiiformans]